MTKIEWAVWANEQAIASVFVLLSGSVLGIAGMFHNWQFGIYGIIASLLILLIEWPRGKRGKGNTLERHFQKPFAVLVDKFGIVGRNYFIRFVLYLLLCVPCCFILATVMGGACLLVTSVIYFVAAIKGEEWKPVGIDEKKVNKKRLQSLHPPKKPPPRQTNQGTGDSTEISMDNITMEITDSDQSQARNNPPAKKLPTRPPPRPRGASRDGIEDSGS